MQVLPEGWELDYDGSRWIYRFTASGLTQYQFPKPGDEFPEFVGVGDLFAMAPEDRLASDRQVKRQTMEEVETGPAKPSAIQRKKKSLEHIKEVAAAEYFDTEKFMYLGPGSFFGSNPVGDQQSRVKLDTKQSNMEHQQTPSSTKQRGEEAKATLTDRPIADNMVHYNVDTVRLAKSQVLGKLSKATKPHKENATTAHSIPSKPKLQSPVGFIAELDSQETRKRADHKSNIESDMSDRSMAGGPDVYFNGLVELHADENPTNTKQPPPQEARVASADSFPLVSASFAFPPLPPKYTIDTPKTSIGDIHPQKPSSLQMARPFSCHEATMSRDDEPSGRTKRNETRFASMPEMPSPLKTTGWKPQRHSVHGPGPVAASPSSYPALSMPSSNFDNLDSSGAIVFKNHQTTHPAPRLPPKIPLSPTEIEADSPVDTVRTPGSEARHERISSNTSRTFTSGPRPSGLTQCPSVLRPGYYRSSVTGQPQQNQRPSVQAAPDKQQSHQQHLPHIPPIQHSHHAHEFATLHVQMKPQAYGGLGFEEPVVRMPDERDFAVRPTATTRAASEPVIISSSATKSSLKPSSNGPGLAILHEDGPIGSRRESEPGTLPSRTRETWTKDTYELDGDTPLLTEPPLEGGTKTKLYQRRPFVAPLRLSPSPGRCQAELPPSIVNATQGLAAMLLVQRERTWSAPNLRSSDQAMTNSYNHMSGSTVDADGTHRHASEAVNTMPLKPASRTVPLGPMDRASGARLPGPQAPSPLTRPASLAQSEVSSSSGSSAPLHHVPVSTLGTRPSASETAPRYSDRQTPTRDQLAADIPPTVGKARGSSAWSTSSINYSGDDWGQDWQEECPGVVPEGYL